MYRSMSGLVALVVLTAAVWSADPPPQSEPAGKGIRDLWDAAYLDNVRAGYIRTTVRQLERDGRTFYHTTVALELTLRRFQDTIRQQLETGTVETADGKVTTVWMSQALGKDQKLTLTGTVQGNQLMVKVSGTMTMEKAIPWNEQVLGLYREQEMFKEKKAKPGDRFIYLHYEPIVNAVVTVQVTVKDEEELEMNGSKQKLLQVEVMPDKIMGVQLPGTTFWLDKDRMPIRSQTDMPGLGRLTTVRTTREVALSPVAPAKITDIGLTQLIGVNRRLARPHDAAAIIYRITLPGDAEPAKALAVDGRQQVQNPKGKSFELHVRAVRKPDPDKAGQPAPEQFLLSNYFINSDDSKVQDLARKAVGNESDPWKKAQKIEKWVQGNMKIQNFTEAMATADNVARNLQGDCTEYAMLTAAMCRAVGVPSRTAIGLVYVDMAKGPVFGYHMWTEVYVQGQWLGLDATLGRGSIGPAHIKITDHSWHDTRSLAPLLPVMRLMLGKAAIEVVRVEGSD